MAFCKQCGTDMGEAKFCPSCGAAADGAVVAAAADPRQRSLADMEQMTQYFGAKKEQYDEFDLVSAEVEDRASRGYFGWIVTTVIFVIIGILSKALFFYIAAPVFIVAFVLLRKKNKEKLAVATARRDELAKELEQYYNDYGYCPIGMEYTKPEILGTLYDIIRKGRASNPGDAINLYLADLAEQEKLRLAQETAEAAKEAAKQAKKNARYSAASFWLKK